MYLFKYSVNVMLYLSMKQISWIPNRYFIGLHIVQVIILTQGAHMCWQILVVPHTLHSSPPKYKHTSEPGSGGDLNVYSNRQIVNSHHSPLSVTWYLSKTIKKLWGGPCEDQNAHSRFSGSNGYITTIYCINIHIENTNVVCLFFEFSPFNVTISKFILRKIFSVIYFLRLNWSKLPNLGWSNFKVF